MSNVPTLDSRPSTTTAARMTPESLKPRTAESEAAEKEEAGKEEARPRPKHLGFDAQLRI